MKLLAFWRRPIPQNSPKAAFSEGLFMALTLSFYWFIASSVYFFLFERHNLTPLAIVFFGTTFFAVPSCILGGFTAIALHWLLHHLPGQFTEAKAILIGIGFGIVIITVGMLVTQSFTVFYAPKAVGYALYLALCGRLGAKINEVMAKSQVTSKVLGHPSAIK